MLDVAPHLIAEWDFAANDGKDPNKMTAASKTKVGWRCAKGHSWTAATGHRVAGAGCPYCSGRLATRANNLAARFPELAKQWHPTRNSKPPSKVLPGSPTKAWWICDQGHEWNATVSNRTRKGYGCPICQGRLPLSKAALSVVNPELAAQLHPTLNGGLTADKISHGSSRKLWWICEKGHVWQATPNQRSRGSGCHECHGRGFRKKLTDGYSLAAYSEVLAEEWHKSKNDSLTPEMVTPGSGLKVWWQCLVCDYEWEAQIDNRKKGAGCPQCTNGRFTSYPEQALLFYIRKIFPSAVGRHKVPVGGGKMDEADIFIPEIRWNDAPNDGVCIEYDGYFYHKDRADADINKTESILSAGHGIIRVRESNGSGKILPPLQHPYLVNHCYSNDTALAVTIKETLNLLLHHASLSESHLEAINGLIINLLADRPLIYAELRHHKRDLSLGMADPEMAVFWHGTRNRSLTPWDVLPGSVKRVWWQCPQCQGEWHQLVNRQCKQRVCPYCAGFRAGVPRNLAVTHPELASQWHVDNPRRPEEFLPGSTYRALWQCPVCRQIWDERIGKRTEGSGCPYCSGKRVYAGNSLRMLIPEVAKQWHPTRNGEMTPDDVTANSGKKVWWLCQTCGHEWKVAIASRNSDGSCPRCNFRKVDPDNTLGYLFPDLAQDWNPKRNGNMSPMDLAAKSNVRVWWTCRDCGHEWATAVANRTVGGTGCPVCRKAKRPRAHQSNSH